MAKSKIDELKALLAENEARRVQLEKEIHPPEYPRNDAAALAVSLAQARLGWVLHMRPILAAALEAEIGRLQWADQTSPADLVKVRERRKLDDQLVTVLAPGGRPLDPHERETILDLVDEGSTLDDALRATFYPEEEIDELITIDA